MKVRRYKEKETVTITLTAQEAWDLQMVCHSATVYNKQEYKKYKKDSELYNHCRDLMYKADYFDKLISITRLTSEIEVVEED